MGYALVYSPCFACGQPFGYNPHRVPSIRPTPDFPRQPVCQPCMREVNLRRTEMGLLPHVIYPDAYEPIEEHEI